MTRIHPAQSQGQTMIPALGRGCQQTGCDDQFHHGGFTLLADLGRLLHRLARHGALTSLMIMAFAMTGSPAAAQSPVAWLFETPHLKGLEAGDGVTYSYQMQAPDLANGEIKTETEKLLLTVVERHDERPPSVSIIEDPGGRENTLETFQGVPGNPMLMVFLERVVGSLHRTTGGSPFYLRNRMKDAFRVLKQRPDPTGGGDIILTAQPFQTDRNRARLGPFGNMELTFRLNPAKPGMFIELSAIAGDDQALKLSEEIRLDPSP